MSSDPVPVVGREQLLLTGLMQSINHYQVKNIRHSQFSCQFCVMNEAEEVAFVIDKWTYCAPNDGVPCTEGQCSFKRNRYRVYHDVPSVTTSRVELSSLA